MDTTSGHVLGPGEGESVQLLALGVRFLIDGRRPAARSAWSSTRSRHAPWGRRSTPTATRTSTPYVLEGRFGLQLGDEVLEAGPGDLVFKPRGVPHAFWNAGDEPAAPARADLARRVRELLPRARPAARRTRPDEAAIAEVVGRYQLDIDFATIPTLAERHNLRLA